MTVKSRNSSVATPNSYTENSLRAKGACKSSQKKKVMEESSRAKGIHQFMFGLLFFCLKHGGSEFLLPHDCLRLT